MSERVSDRNVLEYVVVALAAMVFVLFTAGQPTHTAMRVVFPALTPPLLKDGKSEPPVLDLPPSPNAPDLFTLYQAARDGDPKAAFDLGNIYAAGVDGPPDEAMAIRWFSRAAAQGLPDAQYNLAVFYAKGYGVPKDPERAVPLFQAAADQGLPDAQVALGLAYRDGYGIQRDFVKAAQWFEKGANLGNSDAMILLAESYEDGHGVARNQVEALKWLILAERAGQTQTKEFRDYLLKSLTPAQKNDAQTRAEAFIAAFVKRPLKKPQ